MFFSWALLDLHGTTFDIFRQHIFLFHGYILFKILTETFAFPFNRHFLRFFFSLGISIFHWRKIKNFYGRFFLYEKKKRIYGYVYFREIKNYMKSKLSISEFRFSKIRNNPEYSIFQKNEILVVIACFFSILEYSIFQKK